MILIMKIEVRLADIEYNKKFEEINDNTVNGDNYISSTLKFRKDTYTSDEIVTKIEKYDELIKRVVDNFIKTFHDRGLEPTEEQIYFAKETTEVIFGKLKDKNIISVVNASPGFGKSTIKIEILKVLIENYKSDSSNFTNGVILVGDRLEDLRDIVTTLNDCGLGGYAYMLESWNRDICLDNKIVMSAGKMCSKCDYLYKCKIGQQQREQNKYPILLMTNARLKECADSIQRYKKYDNGERTLLLVDERPELLDTLKVNKSVLNEIDTYISNLEYKDLEDKTRLLNQWKDITDTIEKQMSLLRIKYKRFILKNSNNIGICKENDEFMKLWNKYVKSEYKRELNHIHKILTEGGFYVCEGSKEFISSIGIRDLTADYSNDFKTIIFDGSALYDPLYLGLYNQGKIKYLYIKNSRTYENLNIEAIMKHKVTKTEFKNKKYLIKALCNFVSNKAKQGFGYEYVITYKETSKRIGELLGGSLKSKVLKEDDGGVFYFGNTKGSNSMSKCNRMFQLGWNTLPDYEYVIQFLSCSGIWEKILKNCTDKEMSERYSDLFMIKDRSSSGKYKSINKEYRFGLEALDQFKYLHIASEFYQEVHRTQLRIYDCDENVDVILFRNLKVIFELIKGLFPKCNLIYNTEEIYEFVRAKNDSRENKVKGYDEFFNWYNSWDGSLIKAKEIKSICNINNEQYKTLCKNSSIRSVLNNLIVPKKGYYSKFS